MALIVLVAAIGFAAVRGRLRAAAGQGAEGFAGGCVFMVRPIPKADGVARATERLGGPVMWALAFAVGALVVVGNGYFLNGEEVMGADGRVATTTPTSTAEAVTPAPKYVAASPIPLVATEPPTPTATISPTTTPPPAVTPTPSATSAAERPGGDSSGAAPAESTRMVPSSRGSTVLSASEKFIASAAGPAQASEKETGVPAAVTIAQAILESDWGRSTLSQKANNYFGIKASSGQGPAGVVNMDTWEVLEGVNVTLIDAFKAYHNLEESFLDHGHFLRDNSRYAAAFSVTDDPAEFARRIAAAGYATDPAYASKLIALIQTYGLDRFDLGTAAP